MTAQKDLKHLIRDRQAKTGESYSTARAHVMRERASRLGLEPDNPAAVAPSRLDAIVLKVGAQSVRVRIPGEPGQLTFRSSDVRAIVPGHIVTLVVEKRWTWLGDAYASGRLENPRIDVAKLELAPLPLHNEHLLDLRQADEGFRSPDPYAPLWRKLTAKPRMSYEMDGIAWGDLPGSAPNDNPTCDASELIDAGDPEGAREILMNVLHRDLRCIDAHGLLGLIEFECSPERALVHYELAVQIGDLSLPPGFDGVMVWGQLYNRAFLRCLKGYALCLWRLGETPKAEKVFRRILSLNPNDNQGVRFCRADVRDGLSWDEAQDLREPLETHATLQ
jgi:tetratricopeptide (TPR) repeat protein